MKIAHIVGNRPQFIKLSLLYRAWQRKCADRALIIHTGQHFSDNMSAIFFEEFGIPPPDYQLNINSLPHGEMIGRMLIGIDAVLATEKPDAVIVYGDTNTTLAGALAGKKRNIPVVHVEAGIRTGKEDMPEESNRYLTDRLADVNFACTYLGVENLLKEGFVGGEARSGAVGLRTGDEGMGPGGGVPDRSEDAGMAGGVRPKTGDGMMSAGGAKKGSGTIQSLVYNTGDLMLDAALLFKDKAREQSTLLRDLSLQERPFVLATIHRAENVEDPAVLAGILQALHSIHQDIPVVVPVHPKTRQMIDRMGIPLSLHITPPLGYLDMLALVQACRNVVTDSGGLSREAFFFHKPSLVVMQHPFWPEIFVHGPSLPAAAAPEALLSQWRALVHADGTGRPFQTEIFGDGAAAEKITDILLTVLKSF